jgi:uncharacterized protein YpmB
MSKDSKRDLFVMACLSGLALIFIGIGDAIVGNGSFICKILAGITILFVIIISQTMHQRTKKNAQYKNLKEEKAELYHERADINEFERFLKTRQAKNILGSKYKESLKTVDINKKDIQNSIDEQNVELQEITKVLKDLSSNTR